MLTSTSTRTERKSSDFPKLMEHKCGTIILATRKNEDSTFCGTVVRPSTNAVSNYPLGTYRIDWTSFYDFFGTVELKSE